MLNPDLPTPGRDKLSVYREKFGDARIASMLPQMQETGLQHGVYRLYYLGRMFLAFVRMANYGHIFENQFIFPYLYLYVGYRDLNGLSIPMQIFDITKKLISALPKTRAFILAIRG